jgi:hypothetical protein
MVAFGRPIGNTFRTVDAVFKTLENMGVFPFKSGANEFACKEQNVCKNAHRETCCNLSVFAYLIQKDFDRGFLFHDWIQ